MGGPNISRILAKAKQVYDDLHDQWLASDEIGVNVTLYYPPTYEDCVNCESNSYGIVYKAGGPAPFNLGDCPMCGSQDCKKENEVSEDVKLRIYSMDPSSFSKQSFKKLGISIDQPQGEYLTIGSADIITKIRSCNYAVFYSDQRNVIGDIRVKLSMEPQMHGFTKDRYFYCFWNRI
jgi:hypothetical protein